MQGGGRLLLSVTALAGGACLPAINLTDQGQVVKVTVKAYTAGSVRLPAVKVLVQSRSHASVCIAYVLKSSRASSYSVSCVLSPTPSLIKGGRDPSTSGVWGATINGLNRTQAAA